MLSDSVLFRATRDSARLGVFERLATRATRRLGQPCLRHCRQQCRQHSCLVRGADRQRQFARPAGGLAARPAGSRPKCRLNFGFGGGADRRRSGPFGLRTLPVALAPTANRGDGAPRRVPFCLGWRGGGGAASSCPRGARRREASQPDLPLEFAGCFPREISGPTRENSGCERVSTCARQRGHLVPVLTAQPNHRGALAVGPCAGLCRRHKTAGRWQAAPRGPAGRAAPEVCRGSARTVAALHGALGQASPGTLGHAQLGAWHGNTAHGNGMECAAVFSMREGPASRNN